MMYLGSKINYCHTLTVVSKVRSVMWRAKSSFRFRGNQGRRIGIGQTLCRERECDTDCTPLLAKRNRNFKI